MPLPPFIQKGLSTLLKVVHLSEQSDINQSIKIITTHLTLTTEEIAQAYQRSYELALNSIIAGLGKPLLADSRNSIELAKQIIPNYLQPFATQRGWHDFTLQHQFCTETMAKCQILLKHKTLLFHGEATPLTETDVVAIMTDDSSLLITELMLEQLQHFEATRLHLNELFVAFLSENELLGTAILFFLDEVLRHNEKFRNTINALQKQNAWQDVRALKDSLQELITRFNLSEQIKTLSEFSSPHNNDSLKQIQNLINQLKQLVPNHPQYCQLMTMGGSLLFSVGELPEAEYFFVQAKERAPNQANHALLASNLFQIRLRYGQGEQALADLQEAIAIDASQYALHHIDRYPIIIILGAGGMGCVFLCQDRLQKKLVVIKCFWEPCRELVKDVFQEVFAMSDIAGEFIPMPLDYGYVDPIKQERAFFVIEHIDGAMDGEKWLQQHGKLNLAQGLEVGLKIANGLQIAHTAGLLHLDLKPGNVLLKSTKHGIEVKIIDFGLAQTVRPSSNQTHPASAETSLELPGQLLLGTIDYAAPEQQGFIQNYGKPTVKSDIFAFGATLYHLLTNESPRKLNPKKLMDAPELFGLLCDCIEENPKKRPSLNKVINRINKLYRQIKQPQKRKFKWPQFAQQQTTQQDEQRKQQQLYEQAQRQQAQKMLANAEMLAIKDESTFQLEVLQETDLPVLVYYWADWIKICLKTNFVITEIAQEYTGLIKIITLNIDDNPMIPSQYDLQELPTMMLFKNGHVEAIKTGQLSKSQLSQFLNQNL
jgi:serine/threonine protein kinase